MLSCTVQSSEARIVIIMIRETFAVGMLQCNCTVLGCKQTRRALVIDPGDEGARILEVLRRNNLTAEAILLTHGHLDHICATKQVAEATGAPVMMHPDDQPLYEGMDAQANMCGLPTPELAPIDKFIADGDEIVIGTLRGTIIHTPGHSPGSVCLSLPAVDGEAVAAPNKHLYAGDTIFYGGVGRTDLWGGSMDQLLRSIRERILTLPDETFVIPGHGPATTVGQERTSNPFLVL